MNQLTVQQQVAVKVIVTESFRQQMVDEARHSIKKIDDNLARLADVTPEAQAQDSEDSHEIEFHRQRLENERQNLYRMRKELEWRIKEAESIKEGAELPFQTITAAVDLKVGDNFLDLVNIEVVLKDWEVVAIRRGDDAT